jgi:hypothetical protein
MDICSKIEPQMTHVAEDHLAACFLLAGSLGDGHHGPFSSPRKYEGIE